VKYVVKAGRWYLSDWPRRWTSDQNQATRFESRNMATIVAATWDGRIVRLAPRRKS
jgi:hypothetical protein